MPFSSPTTTSAVNENRRPPLTTLATRLISTTRSWRSKPEAEMDRSGAAMNSFELRDLRSDDRGGAEGLHRLEDQAALAGALGQGLHAAVELVAATVEDDGLDARGLRALGQQRTGALGLLHRLERAQVGLRPLHGGQRAAGVVVDDLGEDPAVGAEHRDARALGRAVYLRAHAPAALEAL